MQLLPRENSERMPDIKNNSVSNNSSHRCLCQVGILKDGENWTEENVKEYALKICKEFLLGGWRTLRIEDFTCRKLSGGLSNLLYVCGMPPTIRSEGFDAAPREVLLRIHCQIHDALMKENIIFTVLSERKIGPKLYGVFKGGRLEEFVQGSALFIEDLKDPKTVRMIAQQTAKLHTTDIPICKEPKWIMDSAIRWWSSARNTTSNEIQNAESVAVFQELQAFPFDEEICFLRNLLNNLEGPVTFCHNDIQEGNILKLHKEPCDLMLIDFEYCGYNYSTFDIANHFCEWGIDYLVDKPPYFAWNPQEFPSVDQQTIFVRAYLKALEDLGAKFDIEEEQKRIMAEIPIFIVISHFLWSLWSMVQAKISPIQFGYVEYAEKRLLEYQKRKALIKLELNGSF